MAALQIFNITIEKIGKLPDLIQQRSFAKALNESIKLDTAKYPPQPSSAIDIRNEFGISIKLQLDYGISLTKKQAVKFLNEFGYNIKYIAFNRKYNANTYQIMFKRKPSKLNNILAFTYAEVLHMVEYEFEIEFPNELKSYIND